MGESDASSAGPITPDVVARVAHLSRLALTDEQKERIGAQLGDIVAYVERMRTLDLQGVEPMAHPLESLEAFRPDEPGETLPNESLMKMAPASDPPFVRVPKVLGGGEGA